jgi:hypothetical protein
MRFFILRTSLRFGENTLKKAYNQIMYNSRTKSTLLPATLPEDLNISPPPISCAENKKHVVICLSMCLQYMISIFAPFRSRICVRSSRLPLILHYTFIPIIHFSTPRLREILISISQASFTCVFPKPFSAHFQWSVFHFCDEFAPLIA